MKFFPVLSLIAALTLSVGSLSAKASPAEVQDYVMHHIADGTTWHPLPFVKGVFVGFLSVGNNASAGVHALMLLIAAFFCFVLFAVLYRKDSSRAPSGITNLLEVLVLFVRNELAVAYLGRKDGERFAPLLLTMFFFILTANLMGMVPLFTTATANLNVTLALASLTFIVMIFGGILKNGPITFIKSIVPSGVPVVFVPLLFLLEVLGIMVKPFALTIRLFANMLAGHMVIAFLVGLLFILGIVALPALVLALFIYGLEVLVAFIQAYIFTLLSSMFIGSMLHPSH